LLQALVEWAEANPLIEKLRLAVLANNETAIGLYRKLGFVEERAAAEGSEARAGAVC
jgi:ribosomal protein S18 acetylase RimI-like enzyme